VVEQTNKVGTQRIFQELDKMQGKLNDCDVDQVIDSVLIGLLDYDLTKVAHLPNANHNNNERWIVLLLIGKPLHNLTKFDFLSLLNSTTKNYMPFFIVALLALYVLAV
jgi:hypothetical protein